MGIPGGAGELAGGPAEEDPQEEGEQVARRAGRGGKKARGKGGVAGAAAGQGRGGQGWVRGFLGLSWSLQWFWWLVRPKPDWNDGKRGQEKTRSWQVEATPSAWSRSTPSRCVTAANGGLCSKSSGAVLAAQRADGKEARAQWGTRPRRGPGRLFRVLEGRWEPGEMLSIAFSVEDLDLRAQRLFCSWAPYHPEL